MSDLALFRSVNHWLSDKRMSDERMSNERKGNSKMNTWPVSDPGEKKFSGERIANLEKMSECPALMPSQVYAMGGGGGGELPVEQVLQGWHKKISFAFCQVCDTSGGWVFQVWSRFFGQYFRSIIYWR